MPPTPECTMRAATSSVPSLRSAPTMASTEPCTSPLMTQRELLAARPPCSCCIICSSVRARAGRAQRLAALAHAVVGDLAGAAPRSRRRRTGRRPPARRRSPGSRPGPTGRPRRPCSPRSSMSARTRPHALPATTMSPTRSVPRCTSTVATGPRPRSSLASMTTPSAERFGLALRSRISACRWMASSSLSRPVRFSAETSHLERLARHALDDDLVLQQLGAHRFGIGAAACRSC